MYIALLSYEEHNTNTHKYILNLLKFINKYSKLTGICYFVVYIKRCTVYAD